MPFIRLSTLVLSALVCLSAGLQADTVILKSGEKLEGKILSETDAEITMSVQVSATIKDERVLKRDEIEKVQKIQPEEEAWVAIGSLVPGTESLERDDYERTKTALQYFITSFPSSAYVAVAKERLDLFTAEQARVNKGEVKLNNQWLAKEKVQEERVQVAGRILYNRMKRAVAASQLPEAMAFFDQLEKGFSGSASYPDAVELGRRVLPALKTAIEQKQAQLKRRIEDEKLRLTTSKGTEHDQLEALIKKERAATEATIAANDRAGMKWFPLQHSNERSLSSLTSRVASETSRLNGLRADKMQESLKASATAAAKLAAGNLEDAGKALKEATSQWPENELAKRLQVKLADATKAAETKAKAATPTPAPAPTATPKPKTSSSTNPGNAPAAPVEAERPEEPPLYKRPFFYIALAVVVAFSAVAGKVVAKSRANSDDVLDK